MEVLLDDSTQYSCAGTADTAAMCRNFYWNGRDHDQVSHSLLCAHASGFEYKRSLQSTARDVVSEHADHSARPGRRLYSLDRGAWAEPSIARTSLSETQNSAPLAI